MKNSELEVFACEKSINALDVAKENAKLNSAEIKFIEDDILNPDLKKYPDFFDVIVSNPPYVSKSEKEVLHQNVIDYEPHQALFVEDEDALIFYRSIADFASKKLNNGGYLYFEINEAKGEELMQLLKSKGFSDITLRKDLNGKERMIQATKLT